MITDFQIKGKRSGKTDTMMFMGHLHTGENEHDFTSSAFIVLTTQGDPRILFHKHKILGVLLQPGGHVEVTENPWQAVLHEIVEETGYDFSQLKVLQPATKFPSLQASVVHPVPVVESTHLFGVSGTHYHTDHAYAFVTDEELWGTPGEGESADLVWLTLNDLMNFEELHPEDGIIEDVRRIAIHVLQHCLSHWVPTDISSFATGSVAL